jgi:hypothetical protein
MPVQSNVDYNEAALVAFSPDGLLNDSTVGGNTMVRSLILSVAMVMGIATIANAGFGPGAIGNPDKLWIRIAEECGPGWWRGPEGRCHPMAKGRVCPKGYHLGPEGGRCLPN